MAARARGEGKTPVRNIRAENDQWAAFSLACKASGQDRSTVLRSFIDWYARRDGAAMPKRPTADAVAAVVAAEIDEEN